jgi:glycosyltransferase involved in cell wall biosynthesis
LCALGCEVVLEAARCGCLLVTSDHVGARSDLISAKNGRVFHRGNARELAQVMRELLGLNEEQEAEGRAESLRLSARFTSLNCALRLGEVIRELAEKSERTL